MLRLTPRRACLLVLCLTSTLAACGGDDDDAAPATTSTTEPQVLEIVITNDDGVTNPGIDAIAVALTKEPGTKVTVVAPFDNQTGAADTVTDGELIGEPATTSSGMEATAVHGHPADSVIYALTTMGLTPDLVVSGSNAGQNVGPITEVSGTVGAAKTAVRRGVPAVAVSTSHPSPGGEFDFATAARLVVDWVRAHRGELLAGTAKVELVSFDVPTCIAGGAMRGLVQIDLATDLKGRAFTGPVADCTSTKPESALEDDVDALANGFATESVVPVD